MTIREGIARKTIRSILSISCLVSLSSAETASATFAMIDIDSITIEHRGDNRSTHDLPFRLAEDPEPIIIDPGGEPVRVVEDPEQIIIDPGGEPVRVAEDPEQIIIDPGGEPVRVAEDPEQIIIDPGGYEQAWRRLFSRLDR
ncbi:MAG: hypothetical protein AAF657_03670 [Acidobacteriota bacterium]